MMRQTQPERPKACDWLAIAAIAATAMIAAEPSRAAPADDEAVIAQRLERWKSAFNARDVSAACDLFAPDLLYAVPELAQGTRETMCANLARVLARPDLELSYASPDVHEITVAGNVAIARLTWTLTAQARGTKDVTEEEGIDIFRRQPDGRWAITRFIAFTRSPNKLLQK